MGHDAYDEVAVDAARQELVSYGCRMITDRLAVGTAGNLSVRVGEVVAISPSGVPYHEMRAQDVCVVTLGGDYLAGSTAVSSEWPMHSGIYATTDARAVVHTHSEEVVALSITREELPAVHYVIVGLGGPVPVVGYTRFGSDTLAGGAVGVLQTHHAAILQNHGAVTRGQTLAQAYDRALLLEWLTRVYRKSLSYGTPRILSEDELLEVRQEVERRRYGGLTSRPEGA
ncbi:MAG: class II aldolase/adducin family protein [Acidimicrobiales bacterium]